MLPPNLAVQEHLKAKSSTLAFHLHGSIAENYRRELLEAFEERRIQAIRKHMTSWDFRATT
jgi:hypothetical protein